MVRLFTKDAPKTVENFVGLATGEKEWTNPDTGEQQTGEPLYDGTIFHRCIRDFMVQGGDPLGRGTGGPGYKFEDEFQSGRKFDKPGLLAMANAGPNTNGSQFFITVGATAWLNNKHTIFGEVVKGYDVVTKVANDIPKGASDRPKTDVKHQRSSPSPTRRNARVGARFTLRDPGLAGTPDTSGKMDTPSFTVVSPRSSAGPTSGKSTLLNRLTGEKVAIVSPKPQTTRNRILGVVTRPEGQVAFLDTPGIHQAKGELNRYMVDVALNAAEEVDLVLFLIEPAGVREGEALEVCPGNRFILERLKRANKPTFLVINKMDEVRKPLLLPLIDLYQKEFSFAEIMPISARTGDGVEALFAQVLKTLPEGEPLFDEDMLTDQAERQLVAEYIREQVLRHCRQEIPYSAAVVVDIFDEAEREPKAKPNKDGLAGLVRIEASIFVERESQKAIVIGKKGADAEDASGRTRASRSSGCSARTCSCRCG